MKQLTILGIAIFFLAGCASLLPGPASTPTPIPVAVEEVFAAPRIPVAEAKQHFDAGDALFVDTRPADEYAALHIPGAVNLPLEELQLRYGELPKDRLIILYCS